MATVKTHQCMNPACNIMTTVIGLTKNGAWVCSESCAREYDEVVAREAGAR